MIIRPKKQKLIVKNIKLLIILTYLCVMVCQPAGAFPVRCGGNFQNFINEFFEQSFLNGISEEVLMSLSGKLKRDQKVLLYDRSQKSFKMSFMEFSDRAVNAYRIQTGKQKIQKFSKLFNLLEAKYGIPSEVVTAFWAMETDFGAVQGNFNTLNSLATLAHDCRRSEMFQTELLAALRLMDEKRITSEITGAWAGEIGQVQMLPKDILLFGVDGNSDGKIDLKNTAEDAVSTAFAVLAHLGWRPNEPWLDEVTLIDNFRFEEAGFGRERTVKDWINLGVSNVQSAAQSLNPKATLLLPQGHHGPSFLAYPNYQVFLKWNQSFIYTVAAAYLANRLTGKEAYSHSNPEDILDHNDMIILQNKLLNLGQDVGDLDGILGAKTRQAVRKWQLKIGFVADGWPTRDFLKTLQNY